MNQPPDFDSNLSPSPQQNLGQSVAGSRVEGAIQGIQGDYNTQIHITNYHYYREDIRTAPVESAKTSADDNLPCPYRGLFHFGPNDTEFFFGREVFIEELVQATAKRSFIPVLGASGSGKSSVVLAGLVPKLQQQGHWLFTHFRPGSDPFYALAEALVPLYTPNLNATERMAQTPKLADYLDKGEVTLTKVMANIQRSHPNHRVLLIADQFEEIYTLCNDESTRRRFLDCLLSLIQTNTNQLPTVLVATMRADFLGSALEYRPFADVLQDDIKLGPMNRTELLEVISKPAQKLGVTLEAGLVKRILDDVENEPGNLPLLEFALTLLWERRNHRQLTHAAYEAIGEVQGALATHADKIYNNFDAADQQQVQRIFMQLVRPGEGTEDTRRIATKSELGQVSWLRVSQLADARLVVTSRNSSGQETVEVVHEALIRHWQLLQSWIDENRSKIIQKNRIERLATEWQQNKQLNDYLLQGKQLKEAQAFQKKELTNFALSDLACKFIQKSIQQRRNNQLKAASFLVIPIGIALLIITPKLRQGNEVNAWQTIRARSSGTRQALELLNEGCKVPEAMRNYLTESFFGKCIVFLRINLSNTNLLGAKLKGANFAEVDFRNADLSATDLRGAYITNSDLRKVKLDNSHLYNADLGQTNFSDADLKGAHLNNARFSGANLSRANLSRANLSGANLKFA
ncbi:pentapeptide repeat-containing protein, partial [Scytonema sp. PRP1]|uniref:pentapeptide repeat-containing protein n=1 Tax=Scytonema sp. PRP1 TaxID=3120513 RepID=UPI002FD10A69